MIPHKSALRFLNLAVKFHQQSSKNIYACDLRFNDLRYNKTAFQAGQHWTTGFLQTQGDFVSLCLQPSFCLAYIVEENTKDS